MKPLESYKTIADWCKDFEKENGKKATFDDFFAWKNRLHNEWQVGELPKPQEPKEN